MGEQTNYVIHVCTCLRLPLDVVFSGMEDYSKTIMKFEKRFCSESACQKYLADIRWVNGFFCPHCRNDKAWQRTNGLHECADCGVQTSVTARTIFQDTKLALHLWLRAIWQIISQKYGANILRLQRILGLDGYRKAWFWLHKLRHAMIRPGRDCLCGMVQADKTYIGLLQIGYHHDNCLQRCCSWGQLTFMMSSDYQLK